MAATAGDDGGHGGVHSVAGIALARAGWRERLPARGVRPLDHAAAHQLSPGRGRDQPVSGHSDGVSYGDLRAGFVEEHSASRKGIFRDAADARGRRYRRIPVAGSVSLFRFLGSDADSHGLSHRHLGARAPGVCGREIRAVHDGRLDPDAGRHHLALRQDRYVRSAGDSRDAARRSHSAFAANGNAAVSRVLPGVRHQGAALPDAHVEAPTAGSVMLAGVLLKLGTYGMMRFCLPLFPDASHRFAGPVAALAIIGIIYGALVALVQPNLKKLVAYSSVSHLGFVVLGIFAFQPISMQGAVYQMLAHGVSTGGLFLLVGMLYDRRHTFEISEYGGLATPMPKLAAFFLFVALSSLGLPMLNGFVGEYLILIGTYLAHWQWSAWAATGVILSACYLLWSYQRVFFGELTGEKNKSLPDVSHREQWILATMAVVILWMGIGSSYITRRTEAAVGHVREQMSRDWAREALGSTGRSACASEGETNLNPREQGCAARGLRATADPAQPGMAVLLKGIR